MNLTSTKNESQDGPKMNIKDLHTQDISDVLSAARLCLCDKVTSIQTEMFRSLFGGVIVGVHKSFHEKLDAHAANKHHIPTVLAELAVELERRGLGAQDYKGFPVSTVGPYQKSGNFPDGHWYGTMGGRIVTAPAKTRVTATLEVQAYVDQLLADFALQRGEEGPQLLELTEVLLKQA